MKALSEEFLKALAKEATNLCYCWRLTRQDGTVLGFTDHDHILHFQGVEFQAMSGFEASELSEMLGLNIDTQEVSGALSSEKITERDIFAGRYDNARLEVFLVDWKNPDFHLLVKIGSIGEIKRSDYEFQAEIRGLSAPLDQTQGRYFSHGCDADLGDKRCTVDLDDPRYNATAQIHKIRDRIILDFTGLDDFAVNWFSNGTLTWLDGENTGLGVEIAAHAKRDGVSVLQLWKTMPFPIHVGERVKIRAGCDKAFKTCKAKFSNGLNFQGFPHLPGSDFLMKFAKRGAVHDGSALIK